MLTRTLSDIRSRASEHRKRIALCDGFDERMVRAAREAVDLGLADMTIVGAEELVSRTAHQAGISLRDIEIVAPASFSQVATLVDEYYGRRSAKLRSREAANAEVTSNDLLFAALLARSGAVDGVLAGSLSTTGDVIRAALRGIGLAEGCSVLSSMFLLCFPILRGIREHEFALAFADGAVVPDPTADELSDIAIATAHTYQQLTGYEPYVGMLSFSTKGSAVSLSVEKVIEATSLVRQKASNLAIDGELQFDAAFVPAVAARKAPESAVAGRANVYVFPSLDAGNIGYKIAERLGMGQAIGPVFQGLARPMNDLSRGASVSDIVNMIAITSLQSQSSLP